MQQTSQTHQGQDADVHDDFYADIELNQQQVNTQSVNKNLMTGSEILIQSLIKENVKYLWGYPGGAVLYIYDALYKQQEIEHLLVRHEQAAIHAADGYARATGMLVLL
jgi:TPP-dependent indolepyruvate ferredoxin oxidoreductase alpha subunit